MLAEAVNVESVSESGSGPLAELRRRARWLAQSVTPADPANPENEMIAKALSLLPNRDNWCVEFGAWDGKVLSNTYNLIAGGYRGVLIEGSTERYQRILSDYEFPDRIVALNQFVGYSKDDNLDALLAPLPIPKDFDFLSIDIDGNDYHVWEAVALYRPKLVVIEFNPSIENGIAFVQERNPRCNQGTSATSLVELAKRKGYELVGANWVNLFFVSAEYFPLFSIPDNSLELVRDDSDTPKIFYGYDGHMFLSQNGKQGGIHLFWHPVYVKEERIQRIPKRLQVYPIQDLRGLDRVYYELLFGFRDQRRWLLDVINRLRGKKAN
jgi:hypothetical protein